MDQVTVPKVGVPPPVAAAIVVPGAGLWLSTEPAGTGTLCALPTAPTSSPAACRLAVAAAWLCPVTLGTATRRGPSEITRSTAEPSTAEAPAAGLCEITAP